MGNTLMPPEERTISTDEKREALDLVLNSRTFARSDILKAFLRFVCEQERAGKASELSEYVIGIEIFGRPDGYSTAEDSTVRSRAHALRRKLQDFYQYEMPTACTRIDLPKGSYCPRFVMVKPETLNALVPVEGDTTPVPIQPEVRVGQSRVLWRVAAGLVLALAVAAGYMMGTRSNRLDPVLYDAWGPILHPDANLLMCIATPANLFVREGTEETRPRDWVPLDASLLPWYRQRQVLRKGKSLFYLPTHNSPLWGETAGAVAVTRLLAQAGIPFQLVPERVTAPFVLRDRNVVLFGRPEFSEAARLLLARAYFQLDWDEKAHDQQIFQAATKTSGRIALPVLRGEARGLITVLPAEGSVTSSCRTIIFSGVDSAGSLGAAEFFTSPAQLKALAARFREEHYRGWPAAFQVVVRTRSSETLPLTVAYEAHHVMTR